MTDRSATYRTILRSTGIVGGASVAVMVIGLLRAKAVALLLGPSGTGALGLLNSLMTTLSALAALGIGTSAVAMIAQEGNEDLTNVTDVTRAVRGLAALLAVTTGILLYQCRGPVSQALAGDQHLSAPIGWLSVGVGFSVLVLAQNGIFQGMRRFGDLARLQIIGTFLGAATGVLFIYHFRGDGIVPAVIAAPFSTWLVGLALLRPLKAEKPASAGPGMIAYWKTLLQVGVPVMSASLVSSLTQLSMRSIVLRDLGIADVGLYQAVIAVTTVNMSLVLTAMSADFFPRLAKEHLSSARMATQVAHQLDVTVVLSMPILIAISAGAPLWLSLLYSKEFAPAANLMRWQVLAEVIRLPTWAYGYALLARRDTAAYFVHEFSMTAATLPLAWILIPSLKLSGAGIASATGYLFCFCVTYMLVRYRHGIGMSQSAGKITLALFMLSFAALICGSIFPRATVGVGAVAVVLIGAWALEYLYRLEALPQRVHNSMVRVHEIIARTE